MVVDIQKDMIRAFEGKRAKSRESSANSANSWLSSGGTTAVGETTKHFKAATPKGEAASGSGRTIQLPSGAPVPTAQQNASGKTATTQELDEDGVPKAEKDCRYWMKAGCLGSTVAYSERWQKS